MRKENENLAGNDTVAAQRETNDGSETITTGAAIEPTVTHNSSFRAAQGDANATGIFNAPVASSFFFRENEVLFSAESRIALLADAIWGLSFPTIEKLTLQFQYTEEEWCKAATQLQSQYARLMPMASIVTYKDWLAHYNQYSECCLYDYERFQIEINKNQVEFGAVDPECWVSGLAEDSGHMLVSFEPHCSIVEEIEDPECIIAEHPDFNWMAEQINAFEKLGQVMTARLKQHGLEISDDYQLLELETFNYKR